MTSRRLVLALLALFAVNGALAGNFQARHLPPSKPLDFALAVLFLLVTYIWYYIDAKEQKYRRTVPVGGAIILLSVVSVPYYLYRSRPPGAKSKALLRYFGFCLLCLVVMLATAFLFLLFAPAA
jgi:hypothetical protein